MAFQRTVHVAHAYWVDRSAERKIPTDPSMTGRQIDQVMDCMDRQSVVELGRTAGRIARVVDVRSGRVLFRAHRFANQVRQ